MYFTIFGVPMLHSWLLWRLDPLFLFKEKINKKKMKRRSVRKSKREINTN
jgi:hypothetical protein